MSMMSVLCKMGLVSFILITVGITSDGAKTGDWANALKPKGENVSEFRFAAKGVASCELMIPSTPTPMDKNAAKELAKWLKAITGANFTIIKENEKQNTDPVISIGLTAVLSKAVPDFKSKDVGAEGYAIEVKGGNLFLWGGTVRGPINAVLALLEEDLGCRWYGPVNRIPKSPELSAPITLRSYKPQFTLRDSCDYNSILAAGNVEWSILNRTNPLHSQIPAEWGGHEVYPSGWFVHSSVTFMPDTKYFAKHPEYFMMDKDGMRSGRQICPSNPEVHRIAIEEALKILRKSASFTMIDISKNDNLGICQCPACKALNEKESNALSEKQGPDAAFLLFVNKVAEAVEAEFPHIKVTTLAYQDTSLCPKSIKPRGNVIIRICTNSAGGYMPRVDQSTRFVKSSEEWMATGCPIHVWDYAVQYANYMQPYPNLSNKASNLRYFNEKKWSGVLMQGCYPTPGGEREWLRSWVFAKLLWDPSRDLWILQQDFIRGCYGKAAPPIEKYNLLLHQAGLDGRERIGLERGFIEESRKLFDEAERLAAGDMEVLRLIREERLAVDCCLMDKLRDDLIHAPEKVDTKQYLALLDTIEKSTAEFKVTYYSETCKMEAWLMKMRNSVSVPAGESRRTFNVEGGKAEFIKLSASWDFRFIKLSGGGDSVKVPSTIGDKEKWFESNSTDHWSLFRTDLGVGWEAQGYPDSAGVGWFKKNITIPEKIDGKRLYLFFESCDEDACVWIDGQPFAEHSCASTGMWPEQIWCKPFAVDLTGKISTGQHQLTVKVYNRDGMGGIYLPVYLIVTDIPLTAEQMKKYANDHFSKFMPRLKKVTLNGKKFFNEDENVSGQNIEADPSKPVIIEYTFENVGGDCPFSVPARVFVHFNNGTTTLKGDSFYPKTPINKWEKGETYSNTTEVDLSKQKGQKLKMCLGIVIPDIKECLKMKNKMDGYPQIIIGTITVK